MLRGYMSCMFTKLHRIGAGKLRSTDAPNRRHFPSAVVRPAAAYRQAVRESGADYVYLSLYHPRDTIRTTAWRAGTGALMTHAKAVHVRAKDGGGAVTSVLLKMDR